MKNKTQELMNKDTSKQIRKIRRILKTMGYLKSRTRPITEKETVYKEGRS